MDGNSKNRIKLIRTAAVPESLNILLRGQLKFLNNYFEVTAIASHGKDLFELKAREKVKIKDIEIKRKISIIKDFIALFRLFAYFRSEKPTIVHSITPKAGLLSMVAAKLAGVPIRMHTFTGLIFPTSKGLKKRILIVMDKILCWAATNIYPEGEGVKKDLQNFKITRKPLKVIANGNVNGIDLCYFDPSLFTEEEKAKLREKLQIDKSNFVYIFVGRISKDKGINELISAFTQIGKSQAKLLLVGPSEQDLDPVFPETLVEIETNTNIISVGFQKDVRLFFAISDCLVFPSYREGFPNVVMQAGAMELPSIVTDVNGSNEIIKQDINGTIIPAHDVIALQQQMTKMIENKSYCQNLKSQTRNLISARYEQNIAWSALIEEYNSLLIKKRNVS